MTGAKWKKIGINMCHCFLRFLLLPVIYLRLINGLEDKLCFKQIFSSMLKLYTCVALAWVTSSSEVHFPFLA